MQSRGVCRRMSRSGLRNYQPRLEIRDIFFAQNHPSIASQSWMVGGRVETKILEENGGGALMILDRNKDIQTVVSLRSGSGMRTFGFRETSWWSVQTMIKQVYRSSSRTSQLFRVNLSPLVTVFLMQGAVACRGMS